MPDPLLPSQGDTSLEQTTTGDRNQAIGQMLGGMAIGQLTVYLSQLPQVVSADRETEERQATASTSRTANPYKGLLAFQERDSASFFGRSREIKRLWEQFRNLQNADLRVLPIYGPSGSGKSSLVRAGLIPELGQRPLPGQERGRVVVLVPGTRPLRALAAVLARIATQDPAPARKTREFTEELRLSNQAGQYDGLHRIASVLPQSDSLPLIVLIDQFEEVYSLCQDSQERDACIANLLYAASDRAQFVSVILTLRSDFLGETQKHPVLNRLFSTQGFLVPTMDADSLREAITEPAKRAKHSLDKATVELLIAQTEGREGTLPLLQVALAQVWEGLCKGVAPAETLREIGGIGGALAGEAQRIYEGLSEVETAITRRVFLRLVQLGDVVKYTRRRTLISSLGSPLDTPEQVRQVIDQFANRSVRMLTLSNNGNEETVEITHEALIKHWQELKDWLEDNRLFLNWQDRLRAVRHQWEISNRDPESLLQGKALSEAEEWLQTQRADLNQDERLYIQASLKARDRLQKDEQERQQREYDLLKKFVSTAQVSTKLAIAAAGLAIAALLAGGFAWYQQQQAQQTQRAFLLGFEPAKPELLKKLPDLLKEADRLRSIGKEENIQLALAYYRKILTDTHALHQAIQITPTQFQKQDEQVIKSIEKDAKRGLVETIRAYRLPQLEAELREAELRDKEHRFTGALQTTSKVLMSNFGAEADLDGNGRIDNQEQAERLPCNTLENIEQLWRRYTNQHCGWYGSKDEYQESACNELEGKTLMTSTFIYPYSEIIKRLNSCPEIPKPTQANNRN